MKKIFVNQYISRLMLLTATLLVAACSAKEDPVVPPVYPTEGVSFSISAEQWGESPLTRAAGEGTAAETVVSLCDEVSASVCCIADLPDPATKASTSVAPKGDYTIVATQGGNETVINVNWNGTAIIDNSTGKAARMDLAPGECNFLCFNDKLERASDGKLIITSARDYENALSGTCQSTIVEGTQTVQFTLKHHFARLKVSIVGVGLNDIANENVYVTKEGQVVHTPYKYSNTEGYSAILNNYGSVADAGFDGSLVFGAISNVSSTSGDGMPAWLTSYQKSETEYIYVPANYTIPDNFSLTFGDANPETGKNMIYGMTDAMAGKTFALNGSGTVLNANDSYTLRLYLSYNYSYLFSDGSTGTLANKWKENITPIAIVASNTHRIAVALKDAGSSMSKYSWCTDGTSKMRNDITFSYDDMYNEDHGYRYTWDPNASTDKMLRAESPGYPAFKASAEYNPGVAISWGLYGSTGHKWYLPTFWEMKLIYPNLGKGDYTYVYERSPYDIKKSEGCFHSVNDKFSWRCVLVNIGMKQAGGDVLSGRYTTATETKSSGYILYGKVEFQASLNFSPIQGLVYPDYSYYWNTCVVSPKEADKVRSFINF